MLILEAGDLYRKTLILIVRVIAVHMIHTSVCNEDEESYVLNLGRFSVSP